MPSTFYYVQNKVVEVKDSTSTKKKKTFLKINQMEQHEKQNTLIKAEALILKIKQL